MKDSKRTCTHVCMLVCMCPAGWRKGCWLCLENMAAASWRHACSSKGDINTAAGSKTQEWLWKEACFCDLIMNLREAYYESLQPAALGGRMPQACLSGVANVSKREGWGTLWQPLYLSTQRALSHLLLQLEDLNGIRQSWGERVLCPTWISIIHTLSGFIVNNTSFTRREVPAH